MLTVGQEKESWCRSESQTNLMRSNQWAIGINFENRWEVPRVIVNQCFNDEKLLMARRGLITYKRMFDERLDGFSSKWDGGL